MRELIKRVARAVARRAGYELVRTTKLQERDSSVISVPAEGPTRGRVLLSYILDPFASQMPEAEFNSHTHFWESREIGELFRRRGFAVDVISYRNTTFVPVGSYDFMIAARTNLARLAGHLGPGCTKVAHLDTAHWLFNNQAAYARLFDLQKRRSITLESRRMIEANWAIEHADVGTVLGNGFTVGTYQYAGKPLHRIPISAPCTYEWPSGKDFDACRRHYLWFGSHGFLHKGLDLVLEAFAGLPDHHLTICGPVDQEPAFCRAFRREMFETPNIHTHGWVDVAGSEFLDIARRCVGLIYPTCSEGGGGSAITCMHAGIIPIVTNEASVDVGSGGIVLKNASIDEIRNEVAQLSSQPVGDLERMAREAWQTARSSHTREHFSRSFSRFVDTELLKAR